MNEFYSIITNKGIETLAAAKVNGGNVKLVNLGVGDSNGKYYEPNPAQQSLVNETYRTTINRIYIDADNSKQIIIEAAIPSTIGGFFIREVAVFDEQNNLFAVGKYPVTFKPESQSGAGKDIYIRITLAFSNNPNIAIYENTNNALVSSDRLETLAKVDLSNVSEENKSHQQWPGLQGGNPNERYHVTQAQNITLSQIDSLKEPVNKGKCIIISTDGTGFDINDLPLGLPMFTVFHSISAKTPFGAYPLWTGEWISDCKNKHTAFWNEVIEQSAGGFLRLVENSVYENEVNNYGETGAFVVNQETGALRLPKITRFVSSIEQINQIGQPQMDQIVNIVGQIGIDDAVAQSVGGVFSVISNLGYDASSSMSGNGKIVQFNASRVVRTGDQVQPRNVRIAQFIQVYKTIQG